MQVGASVRMRKTKHHANGTTDPMSSNTLLHTRECNVFRHCMKILRKSALKCIIHFITTDQEKQDSKQQANNVYRQEQ